MRASTLIPLTLLLVLLIADVRGDVKTWQLNTNFEDPANWNGNGVFCANDKRIFPKAMKASVFIQQNESLQELRLSDNMILVIEEGVALSFGSNPKLMSGIPINSSLENCSTKGRELMFSAAADSWFNPSAWSSALVSSNDSQRFLLDYESVPCEKDSVIFPEKNSFLVNMEQVDMRVASVTVHGELLNSEAAFKKYWNSKSASYEFHNATSVSTVTGDNRCTEDRGALCACDETSTARMEKICQYSKANIDTVISQCESPIRPAVSCSPLCGAIVYLTSNATEFPWDDLHSEVVSLVTIVPAARYAISSPAREMQIVLKDNSTGTVANRVACDLMEHFQKDEIVEKFNITYTHIERSDKVMGCPKPPPPLPRVTQDENSYIIIGISCAIAVILLLLIIMGVFLYKKKQNGNFKNEMEMGAVPGRTVQGFDNPVYDVPMPFDDHLAVSYDAHNEEQVGFHNPIYSPGADSGVSVGSNETEKKKPIGSFKRKKSKGRQDANLGFDNPVYAVNPDISPSDMTSIPLDEDGDIGMPTEVKHDGNGFANPIATGLSEEAVNGRPTNSEVLSSGFSNPLFDGDESQKNGHVADVTVHANTVTSKGKKKKAKRSKAAKDKAREAAESGSGFDNPHYDGGTQNIGFYQPETPGEEIPQMPDESITESTSTSSNTE